MTEPVSYSQIASLFLKLGAVGFGGPQAHIAMMEEQCVERHRWTTRERFLEGVALCQMLPGPASTQLAVYIGWLQRGWISGLLAGLCFVLPAFGLLLLLTWAYFTYGTLPMVQNMFLPVTAVVVAILFTSACRMGKTQLNTKSKWALFLVALALSLLFPGSELWVFLAAGLIGLFFFVPKKATLRAFSPLLLALPANTAAGASFSELFLFFSKVGALTFGGGLVIVPLMEHHVVEVTGWLSGKQFWDGVALGQLTPGPVVITATFVGYAVGKWFGALIATLGMFLPAFLYILLTAPVLDRVRGSERARAFLTAVNTTVIAVLLATALRLFYTLFDTWWLPLLALLASALLLRTKLSPLWLLAASALFGVLLV
jgi:chromate transporter